MTELNAACEGDDIPEPIRAFLYGDGFASIDGELQMSAFGPGALATIAKKLLRLGYEPDREIICLRGGQRTARLSLRDAAQTGDFE